MLHAARGGEWRTATVSDPLGRPVSARWLVLPDGTAVVDSAEAIGLPLLGRRRARPAARDDARARRAAPRRARPSSRARCSSVVGGTATVDGGAGMRAVAGTGPARCAGARRCATCATRCSANAEQRACSVRRRARTRTPSRSSNVASRRSHELEPYRDLAGAGAGGGLGAAFAALGAELCDGAAARPRRDRLRRARARAPTSSSPVRAPSTDDARRQGARRGRSPLRSARRPLRPVRRRGARRRRRAWRYRVIRLVRAEDLEALGEQLARSLVERA